MAEKGPIGGKSDLSFYILTVVTACFALFIFSNSLMPGETSSANSGFVLNILKDTFSFLGLSENQGHFLIRKAAHFTEFAVFGVLVNLSNYLGHKKGILKRNIFTLLFIGLSVGLADEFIQLFIKGRSGMVADVVIDFSGFLFGLFALNLILLIKNRKYVLFSCRFGCKLFDSAV